MELYILTLYHHETLRLPLCSGNNRRCRCLKCTRPRPLQLRLGHWQGKARSRRIVSLRVTQPCLVLICCLSFAPWWYVILRCVDIFRELTSPRRAADTARYVVTNSSAQLELITSRRTSPPCGSSWATPSLNPRTRSSSPRSTPTARANRSGTNTACKVTPVRGVFLSYAHDSPVPALKWFNGDGTYETYEGERDFNTLSEL